MTKTDWYYMTTCMLIMLGFIYWLYSLERDKEQDKKQNCEVSGGVYVRPYKYPGICLQIVDGKLKEL